ncbi:ribosome production factor 2 homolog [Aristolochia californica]|uniref:ribosome production factor 2 homolog n=1 Tax=Aristolochia californica TaxID=171875 RepID=UPI0035E31B90
MIVADPQKAKAPKSKRVARVLEKRAPKLVENAKKTLILQGTKTSGILNAVLTEIFHLKRSNCIRYTRKNDNIRPFESGGETSLEFFSHKTDCSLLVFGSHSKKRPHNLVLGRTYDNQIYDLVEVGVENFKPVDSFSYDKKLAPKVGSKPFITFIGEGFESVEELKHLKEVLLDLFHEEVVENLNLAGVDRVFICAALSSDRVFFSHCAIHLKKSGTIVPRMELVEVGPSMDLVIRRHRLPNVDVKKEAMKTALEQPKKKMKNVKGDIIEGTIGRVYIPEQEVGKMALSNNAKGLKRERRESKKKHEGKLQEPKKQKKDDGQ